MVRRVFLFNFTAERELLTGRVETPSAHSRRLQRDLEERMRPLLAEGDLLLSELSGREPRVGHWVGRAWCPTPSALAALGRAGAIVPESPPFDVLRAANHRRFCVGLDEAFPLSAFVTSPEQLDIVLRSRDDVDRWVLKRPLGFAGRDKLRVGSRLSEAERAWVARSLGGGPASDGLLVEPWVVRTADFALHGFIRPGQQVNFGVPTVQEIDGQGTWRGSRRAHPGELTEGEERDLFATIDKVASRLMASGYFGPFGVDAFRWVDPNGRQHFRPLCELNARYTMGYAMGMGSTRPDLDTSADTRRS